MLAAPDDRDGKQPMRSTLTMGALMLLLTFARADGAAPEPPAFKLTLGRHHGTASGSATDVNLRRAFGDAEAGGNAWLGFYDAPGQGERQWRLGADDGIALGAFRLQPAGQVASHRYAAASLGIETGESWFIGAGFGRTNLHQNTNLNFDPNDSYSLSAGLRVDGGASYQLQWVRDNRQNPDQRHLHLVWRTPLPQGQRLTVDLLHKQGLVDDVTIHRWGASLAYDWPRFFVRVAYDPKVNFTPETQWRLSAGTRF